MFNLAEGTGRGNKSAVFMRSIIHIKLLIIFKQDKQYINISWWYFLIHLFKQPHGSLFIHYFSLAWYIKCSCLLHPVSTSVECETLWAVWDCGRADRSPNMRKTGMSAGTYCYSKKEQNTNKDSKPRLQAAKPVPSRLEEMVVNKMCSRGRMKARGQETQRRLDNEAEGRTR